MMNVAPKFMQITLHLCCADSLGSSSPISQRQTPLRLKVDQFPAEKRKESVTQSRNGVCVCMRTTPEHNDLDEGINYCTGARCTVRFFFSIKDIR